MMKPPIATTLLCLAVLTASPSTGMAQSNLVGMKWKLNLEKSKFNPGPGLGSGILNYEETERGFIGKFEGTSAQGISIKDTFGPFTLDGKPYPVAGATVYDATSHKTINDTTTEIVRWKGDKPVQWGTRVLSADGKTLTFTNTGTNSRGEQLNHIIVYDKQ
jgi:hypothetical protein